jgi:enamine deaminase RidA (YjgF/YER057c/UK114 family)
VSGSGEIVGANDAYAQSAFIFRKIAAALERAGASLSDVVRTRMFITRLEDEAAVGRAHFEAVGSVRPAATMVQVSALVDPRLVVEIEADAYIQTP